MRIDRHRVGEMGEICQPQRSDGVTELGPGGRERCEFRIGRRDEHQIARRLVKINGAGAVIDLAGSGLQQVHQSRRFSMKRLAGWSR